MLYFGEILGFTRTTKGIFECNKNQVTFNIFWEK